MSENIIPIPPAPVMSEPKVKKSKAKKSKAAAEPDMFGGDNMIWYGLGAAALLWYFSRKSDAGGSVRGIPVPGGDQKFVSREAAPTQGLYQNPVGSDYRVETETVTKSGSPNNGWAV